MILLKEGEFGYDPKYPNWRRAGIEEMQPQQPGKEWKLYKCSISKQGDITFIWELRTLELVP